MSSKLYDADAPRHIIGSIYKQPSLLEDDGRYFFNPEDFTQEFHRVIFGAIDTLYTLGAKVINVNTIEDYLQGWPQDYAIYKQYNGATWLKEQEMFAEVSNFDYWYNRLKKFTLLREYEKLGMNVDWIYDPNLLDAEKIQNQEKAFNQLTVNDIATKIENKINEIRRYNVDNNLDDSHLIGENIEQLISELQESPAVGPPMYGRLINAITMGKRRGKLYLRSAATGVGKNFLPSRRVIF